MGIFRDMAGIAAGAAGISARKAKAKKYWTSIVNVHKKNSPFTKLSLKNILPPRERDTFLGRSTIL